MELKTPLYDCHVALGGKIVPFAGYLLPVQYQGVIAEHMAVRQACGLFDVSHMGELVYEGVDALANVNHVLTNDFTSLAIGCVRYSPMCNENGGMVDDLLVYRTGEQRYLVVVNASNRAKDFAFMQRHLFGDCTLTDESDGIAQLALQGPQAEAILKALTDAIQIPQIYYSFTDEVPVAGITCLVSRTGYTGEDGFELYCESADAPTLWNALLTAGEPFGLVPCGLGARDTLRLEAAMPLYGHEMDETVSPLETGLGFAVKMDKANFVGKHALLDHQPAVVARIGLAVTGRGIVREDAPLFIDGKQVGKTTSGTHCPFLGKAVAMALVEKPHTAMGTAMTAQVRGRDIPVEVIALPFYKKPN
jgi:glycine cleavage system T protein